jgi:hypothetical protein
MGMKNSKINLTRTAGVAFFLMVLLGGCVTRPLPAVQKVKARDSARLLFQPVEGERLILEAQLLEETNGTLRLTVGKETPVLQIVLQNGVVQAGGDWARRGWRGALANTPQALRGWVAVLQAWELSRQLSGHTIEVHRPDFRLQFRRDSVNPGCPNELIVWPTITSTNPAAAAQFVLKFYGTN